MDPAEVARTISEDLRLDGTAVLGALRLLGEGATVPFIARYRKEATRGLDEGALRQIDERRAYLEALASRRETIEKEIARQGRLTQELCARLRAAPTKNELEDLYLPFKPKRKTRASQAREKGLEPLAHLMWDQNKRQPHEAARAFVDAKKGVPDVEAALQGARDICAERLGDHAALRKRVRDDYRQRGQLTVTKSKAHAKEATKFDNYAAFSGRARDLPSHRVLAIARGEKEGVLKAKLDLDWDVHERAALACVPVRPGAWANELEEVARDALKRIVAPSAQADCRADLRTEAERTAVEVFARNLRELLLAAPFGERPVLGIDPGQRTGCKCAVVDATGRFVCNETIYLVQGDARLKEAKATLKRLIAEHHIAAIAVGNGTHGRETEAFVRGTLEELNGADGSDRSPGSSQPLCVSVNESGASIYSASEVARREFPELDLTVRGAIGIARRLQDPLSQLVKLDPKTIGVGQYQHDVNQTLLAAKLAEVVESCVNLVGVQLNTASAELLSFVAGIGPKLAENIVAHRNQHGKFKNRKELLKVKGLGPKAFEQAAGFLRVADGTQPLDASAVHPERYALVERMARDLKLSVKDLLGSPPSIERIDAKRYYSDDAGEYTLDWILSELRKPGRDPRSKFEAPRFARNVSQLEDLQIGMELEGVVTNVTAFGAFVDVGVHQDGLIHVSQLADRFVQDPSEVAHVGRRMKVRVLTVDLERKRIGLSAKGVVQPA